MLAARHALARRLARDRRGRGIPIVQRGLLVARRAEARAVSRPSADRDGRRVPPRRAARSRQATAQVCGRTIRRRALQPARGARRIARGDPRLAAWLGERRRDIPARDAVHAALRRARDQPRDDRAEASRLPRRRFRDLARRPPRAGLTRCKLHMLRWRPERVRSTLPPVMSDLGLVRYLGYAELPGRRRCAQGSKPSSANISTRRPSDRRAERRWIAGRRRFASLRGDARSLRARSVDELILDELPVCSLARGRGGRALDRHLCLRFRPAGADRPPCDALRLVLITSGTGASTSFAIAEEVIAELYG